MLDLLVKPRARRRRPSSSSLFRLAKRQNTVEMNTSRGGWAIPTPTSSSTFSRHDPGSRTPPSLYLIIFLTLLLLLIGSSSFLVIRGWKQRRRIRLEIADAVSRGEITPERGEQLTRRLDTMTWSMGRWSASWLTLLSEDLAERNDPRMGRRRRRARELGPVPKLYEFDMNVEDEQDGKEMKDLSGLTAYQPFSLFHPTLTPIIPVPPKPRDIEPRYLVNHNINVPRDYRNTRYLATRQHWQSVSYPPSSRHPPGTSSAATGAGAEASTNEEQGNRGEVWIDRVTQMKDDGGRSLPLEASFLIKMPESESTARFRRRVREEEGEEMLHPPMEVAIWKGVLQR